MVVHMERNALRFDNAEGILTGYGVKWSFKRTAGAVAVFALDGVRGEKGIA